MPDDDERIHIIAELDDRTSAPAKKIKEEIRELGDESEVTGDKVEGLGDDLDETGKKSDKNKDALSRYTKRLQDQKRELADLRAELRGMRSEYDRTGRKNSELAKDIRKTELAILKQEAAVHKTRRTIDGYTTELERSATVSRRTRREFDRTTTSIKKQHREWNLLHRASRRVLGIGAGLLRFFFKMGTIVYLAAGALSFLGTALQGIGALAYAGVAGLAPLTGLLIAYPGIIANIIGTMAVFKMATSGMGEAFKVLGDPTATPEEIAAATKNLTENQLKFIVAVRSTKKEWGGLRKEVANRAFRGMDRIFKRLSSDYFPIMDKYLPRQADAMNRVAKYTAEWLHTQRAQKSISEIMKGNVKQTENWGKGFSEALRVLTDLLRYAQPMLNRMSGDFANWMTELRVTTEQNGPKLRTFFNDAYDLFIRVKDVIGDLFMGLYNIGKLSGVFNKEIGGNLEDLSKDFRDWTESKEGKHDIRKWFREMIPVVKELGRWVRDLSSMFAAGSMEPKDFVKSSKALRKTVIPMATDVLEWAATTLPPILDKIQTTYANYKEAGVTGGFGRVVKHIANTIVRAGEVVAGMPDWAKTVLTWVTTLYAAYKIASKFSIAGGVAQALTGGKAGKSWGVQKVFVVNMPPGGMTGGGGGAPIVAGEGAGGKGTKGKWGRVKGGFGRFGGLLPLAAMLGFEYWDSKDPVADKPKDRGAGDDLRSFGSNVATGAAIGSVVPGVGTGVGILGGAAVGGAYWAMHANPQQHYQSVQDYEKVLQSNENWEEQFTGTADEMQTHGTKLGTAFWDGFRSVGTVQGYIDQSIKDRQFTDDMKDGFKSVSTVTDMINASVHNTKNTVDKFGKSKKLDNTADRISDIVEDLKTMPKHPSVTLDLNVNQSINKTINAHTNKFVQDILPGQTEPGLPVPHFAGGPTRSGIDYLVGELGPEAWIDRSTGRIKMLGLRGPEITRLGSGAVIPASGTENPFSGAMGSTPDWAQKAFRAAVTSMVAPKVSRSGDEGGQTVYIDADIHITPTPGMDTRAIAKAVRKEIEALRREARERD